jgi:asparagine synthase (glutamine-hydrolysing)
VVFRGHGDAEVVLHALARFGVERAVARFDGMFALAWWDARARVLWLARDRFGTKPLHVLVEAGRVAFASEVRGLRALPGFVVRPDPMALARRIVPWIADQERTPFLGVENVEPGGLWRVTAAGVEKRRFCDLLGEVDPHRIVAATAEPLERWPERVRDAVVAAVRSHLASDVPVAAFTSGGVDSNLVAAIAMEARPDLVAYTVDTCHPESEVATATRVAAHLGMELRVVRADREALLAAWPATIEAEEHPCYHASHVASLLMSRAAHADGVVVAMTGEGADELFGGYDFLRRTRELWRQATRPWARLTHRGRALGRALREVPFRYQSIRAERETHARFQLVMAPNEESRARALLTHLAPIEPACDRAFVAHSLDALRRHMGSILLRHDRLSMAASIEARVPFLSNRVADLGMHLPVAARIRGRVGKWALKRAAERWLPKDVLYAPKKGFPIPLSFDRGAGELLRGGFLPELFGWTKATEGELVPRVDGDDLLRFAAVSLELWGRLFVRGEPAPVLAERLLALAR